MEAEAEAVGGAEAEAAGGAEAEVAAVVEAEAAVRAGGEVQRRAVGARARTRRRTPSMRETSGLPPLPPPLPQVRVSSSSFYTTPLY